MQAVLNFDAPTLDVALLDRIWGVMGNGSPQEVLALAEFQLYHAS